MADNFTFTTILNAIRENALLGAGPREDDDATAQARQNAIVEGRRIWEDVIGKWRKGDVVVDEELVSAMGRILVIGPRARDWDDVLSLVEQTMNVPRLAPKIGSPERKADHLPVPRNVAKDIEPNEDEEEMIGEFDKELTKLPKGARGRSSVAYVKPSNRTLSLIMEACLKMVAPKVANQYWDLLTAPDNYGMVPDLDNLNMYIRLLRQSRASTRVVEVLKNDILNKGIRPQRKTYRIAMSACNRDKNNANAVKNASAILDMMDNNRSELDIKAVQMFLDLSLTTQDGKTIVFAINRLGPIVQNLKSQLSFGSDNGAAASDTITMEAMLLFRTIIGAIDQLMNKGLVGSEEHQTWTQRRARLAAYVTKVNSRLEGGSGFDEGRKNEMRRESRQLRHFRRNEVTRKKKAEGTFVARKAGGGTREPKLADLPGDVVASN